MTQINTSHIKKLRRGFQPKDGVVLDALLMALAKWGPLEVSGFDDLAKRLQLAAHINNYKAFPPYAPIDISYFKATWWGLDRCKEFYRRHIIWFEDKGKIIVFRERI